MHGLCRPLSVHGSRIGGIVDCLRYATLGRGKNEAYLLDLVAVVGEDDLLQGLLETSDVLLHCVEERG
jgi:hypothetical protein